MHDRSSKIAATQKNGAALPDPLSEMLRGLRLDGVDYCCFRMTAPWGLMFPVQQAARFHFIAEGSAWLRAPAGDWIPLKAGDAVLLPRGAEHALASAPDAAVTPLGRCERRELCDDLFQTSGGLGGAQCVFLSGGMTFNIDGLHPLLRMMPDVMQVHEAAAHEPRLQDLLAAMGAELSLDRVGAGGILARLADVVAASLIRSWVERGCGDATGWIAAARDPDIGRVLAAIHLDPEQDWTLDALAKAMGASRSAFAERFASVVGETPARYVAQVRMHQARQWLQRDRMKIAVVARRLGYESEAAFSRAFKRVIGQAPSHFRAAEQDGETPQAAQAQRYSQQP